MDPPDLQALFDEALGHHRAGRLVDADRLYRSVLAANPRHADSVHLLGVIASQVGRPDLAVGIIGAAIDLDPTAVPYHANLGNALQALGRTDQAIASFRAAIALNPDYAEAHSNLGNALKISGDLDQAAACYRRAIELKPDFPEAHAGLGDALRLLGRLDEALAHCRRAVELKPDCAAALTSMGEGLRLQGQLDDAVASFRQAIAMAPDLAEAHNGLGAALQGLSRLDEAVDHYRRAVEIRPDYPEAWTNLGVARREQGDLDQAVTLHRRAIELCPDASASRNNLADALLARGDLEEGWREYEWRWGTTLMARGRRDFAQPQWRGEAAAGRTLLIHAEQGLGDSLQFCRYAPLAAERGLRVIVEAHGPLVRLLRGLPGVDQVIERGRDLPAFDLHCPMLSLPLAFATTLGTIPPASYLHADAAATAGWRTRLDDPRDPRPRIGLVWAGNSHSNLPLTARVDRRRSIAPERLAPLFEVPGLRWFSLQKSGPAAPDDFPLVNFTDEMGDFADTAALIANLDLVISVDTAVAHLAGALGRPVWLLNRFDTCWRWLLHREDSPWYPTMRLYRQPKPGDWDSVIERVRADLRG